MALTPVFVARTRKCLCSMARSVASAKCGCASLGCNKTPDCFDIHPGDRIAITVLDLAPPRTNEACAFGFDISQAMTLVATDLGNPDTFSEGSTCNSAAVAIAPFDGWTWTSTGRSGGTAPGVLEGTFNATNGSCSGYVTIDVSAPSDMPFGMTEAGQPPNVTMQRSFDEQGDSGAGCPSFCLDIYSVKLTRL